MNHAQEMNDIVKFEECIYVKIGNMFDEVKESVIGSEILELQVQEVE